MWLLRSQSSFKFSSEHTFSSVLILSLNLFCIKNRVSNFGNITRSLFVKQRKDIITPTRKTPKIKLERTLILNLFSRDSPFCIDTCMFEFNFEVCTFVLTTFQYCHDSQMCQTFFDHVFVSVELKELVRNVYPLLNANYYSQSQTKSSPSQKSKLILTLYLE